MLQAPKVRKIPYKGIMSPSGPRALFNIAHAQACRAAGTPVLFFNRYESGNQSYAVTSDNELGGRVVADYLIDPGHKRLGYIAGRPDASTNVDRRNGFLSRCADGQ